MIGEWVQRVCARNRKHREDVEWANAEGFGWGFAKRVVVTKG